MRTEVLATSTAELCAVAIRRAVNLLRQGEIVALPTETVYGLAADALKGDAVAKIFEAKERPRFDPLIVHLPNPGWLERVANVDNDEGRLAGRLAAQFWPGPLTIVLKRQQIIPDIVAAGLETVAVRMSAHPVFAEIIHEFGSPLAAPSANRFGRVSPTTAEHVFDELEGRIPVIVDAGPSVHGIESTIVALRNGRIEILRLGPITADELIPFGDVIVAAAPQVPDAPGQLVSHYAPSTLLTLTDNPSSFPISPNQRCGLLSWDLGQWASRFSEIRELSPNHNLREAAANLFRYLRELDRLKLDLIVAEKLPDTGLGAAINDRLSRAARK